MATAGPRYPGTVATEIGPSGDNDWLTASNVGADDGSEAQITAATYDAADHSYRLKATNFGFDVDIPTGSTINGITVEIDRRAFAGAAQDQEVRLYDSTATLVGDDKQTATAWPATLGIVAYGGAADTWTSGLDAADIRSTGFGVALIVLADAANTDIGVDFIRVSVDYTAPAPSGTGAIGVPSATVAGVGGLLLTATGAVTVSPPSVAGVGEEVFTATGAVVVPVATIAGTGDHSAGAAPTGTGAISVPAPVVAGVGGLLLIGSGAITVPSGTIAGSGALILTGSGAIAISSAMVAGLGAEVFTGTGSISGQPPLVDGVGLHIQPITGTGAIAGQAPIVTGVGTAGGTVVGGLPPGVAAHPLATTPGGTGVHV
jgi:hypothetical protein